MVLAGLLAIMAATSIIGIVIGKKPTENLSSIDFIIWICGIIILGCSIGLIMYLNDNGVLLI